MGDDTPSHVHPFATVRARLEQMARLLDGTEVDLVALGKAYAALAQAMHDDVQRAGRSSMRFEAVRKALDLRTPKSALMRFLDREA